MLESVADSVGEMATLGNGAETVRDVGKETRGIEASADLISTLEQGKAHFLLQVSVGASSGERRYWQTWQRVEPVVGSGDISVAV